MQIDRRDFVKFLLGGAAGINLTPLPWKLTDDIAIWTQNWPWVPVPPTGEILLESSVCTLCPGGCGIDVRKVDSRAVKIEGRTDYPVNPGGLCPLGMGGLQLLYNEEARFTGPMKRVGPRGSGKFVDISWDQALGILSDRISDLRKQGKPEALAAVDGNPKNSTMSLLIERLLMAVGSLNYERIPSATDTFWMANTLMLGSEGPMAVDLENADFILSFGSGLLEGWGAPGRVINAWGLWKQNDSEETIKIVQIESKASNTASKSDQWMALKPGTEAALALGMAHVIIKEKLYNFKFVGNHAFGFSNWSSADGKDHIGFENLVLDKYSPAQVAEITGLKPGQIVSLATEFAEAKAPVAICGKGKGGLSGSLYEYMAVIALNALVGNINKPGGMLVHDPLPLSPLPDIEVDAISMAGLNQGRLDEAGTLKYPFTQTLTNNFAQAIITNSKSPIDSLLVFSANPAYTLPDGGDFKKAMMEIPFIASFSPYQDETAYMADLILPDHTYLEKQDDIVWPTGLQYPLYGISQPVVEPIYNTRNSGDVILKLAKMVTKSIGSAFPWRKYEDVLKTRAKGLSDSGPGLVNYDDSEPVWEKLKDGGNVKSGYKNFDDMWRKIKSGGLWYRPAHKFGDWEKLFKTPTGKFEFFSTQIELAIYEYSQQESMESVFNNMGIGVRGDEAFMPHVEQSASQVDRSAYPLLLAPYEMINLSSGWIPTPPFLYKTLFDTQLLKNESFAEINPKTASDYKLNQGDRVIVRSPVGELKVRINLFEGAMPGVVYLPLGLGHTAYDEFSKEKGVNPNDIILAGKDPLSGHPVWWDTPVELVKI